MLNTAALLLLGVQVPTRARRHLPQPAGQRHAAAPDRRRHCVLVRQQQVSTVPYYCSASLLDAHFKLSSRIWTIARCLCWYGVKHVRLLRSDNLGATLDVDLLSYFAESDKSFVMEVGCPTG